MQSELATMLYKYEYKPGKRIQDLIYHLDRDDFYSRKYWHKNSVMDWHGLNNRSRNPASVSAEESLVMGG